MDMKGEFWDEQGQLWKRMAADQIRKVAPNRTNGSPIKSVWKM